MKTLRKIIIKAAIVLIFIGTSCDINSSVKYSYQPPEQIDDGIKVGTLAETGIDTRYLSDAATAIAKGKFKEVHSMLIFKDNKLVFEEYFQGHKYKWDAPGHHGELVNWDRNMLHGIKSDSKSITSICIGIAIDLGFIKSVHQSVFDYLSEHQHLNTDGKDKITIEHLLTMTSGLEWNEWGAPLSSADNDMIGLWFFYDDPITGVLSRPLINEPGADFTYSGGGTIVLGEIIKNATNMKIDEFSKKYLFEPLAIKSSNWAIEFKNGVIEAAGSLEITPRSMVKIGATFLNKGIWNNKQIISAEWIEKSATNYKGNKGINIPGVNSGKNGYSYSWWINQVFESGKKIEMFNAGGWGGQEIYVIPELNSVVVFTGGNYTRINKNHKILENYIIPAII